MARKTAKTGKPDAAPPGPEADNELINVGQGRHIDDRHRGNVVVAAMSGGKGHGHVLLLAPSKWSGDEIRVYDVNQYLLLRDAVKGGTTLNSKQQMLLADLLAPQQYQSVVGKKSSITAEQVEHLLAAEIVQHHWPQDKAPIDVIHDLYLERGSKLTLSFEKADLNEKDKVVWTRIQESAETAKKLDLHSVGNALTALASDNPTAKDVCNLFVGIIEPVFQGKVANQIREMTDPEVIKHDPIPPKDKPPVNVPTWNETKPQNNTNPGGVSHNAVAEMLDFDASKITRASFDADQKKIVLQGSNGKLVVDVPVSTDELAVALKCVYDREVNPVLSMTFSTERAGNFEVKFTGPIFNTSFGQNMFEADSLLGLIMFGYLGLERTLMTCEFPQWAHRWHSTRVLQVKGLGSRVFMCTEKVTFQVAGSIVKCVDARLRLIHETSNVGYSWVAERESLTLADHLERNQAKLRDMFPVLDDFCRLGSILALLKYLRLNEISFDWEWAKSHQPAKVAFPIFIPTVEWTLLCGGLNFDGWAVDGKDIGDNWKIEEGDFIGSMATGGEDTSPVLYSTRVWGLYYEMEFLLKTSGGPAYFVCKYLPDKPFKTISMPSEGFALFRVSVAESGDVAVVKDGEPFWNGKLDVLYAGTGLDLTKAASFGFALSAGARANIANVRFR
jgi:hypothetical protein